MVLYCRCSLEKGTNKKDQKNEYYVDDDIFRLLEPAATTYNYETLLRDSLLLKGCGICTNMYFQLKSGGIRACAASSA